MKKNNPPIIQSSISPKPQAISPKPLASSPKPKLFITGITGAIGSYFIDYLVDSKYEVYAIFNKPDKLSQKMKDASNFHLLNCLLENIADFKDVIDDCEYIIHLAADWWQDPSVSPNIVSTLTMLSLVNPNKIKRIIYFSTASILGSGNVLLPEAKTYGTNYIVSKYLVYQALQSHPLKDNIVTVFPTMVISGDKNHKYSHIGEGLLEAKKYLRWVRFFSINGSFHFIHADDIAQICLYLLKQKDCKSDYVLGNPSQTIDQAVNEIAKYFGYKTWFKIPTPVNFVVRLIEIFKIKIEPYAKFSLRYKHFVYDSVNATTFGLSSKYDTWTKVIDSIEKAKD